jgi:hypothetical protein
MSRASPRLTAIVVIKVMLWGMYLPLEYEDTVFEFTSKSGITAVRYED